MFKDATLTNLKVTTSDHSPLLLEPIKTNPILQEKSFRFENAWLCEPMCQQIIQEVLSEYKDRSFYDKISVCTEIYQSGDTRLHAVLKRE